MLAPQFLTVVLTNLTSYSKYYYTVGDDVRTAYPNPDKCQPVHMPLAGFMHLHLFALVTTLTTGLPACKSMMYVTLQC